MLLRGERTQSERWMDKVEKAEGVNRKFWSAYKSDSAHAGDLLKVSQAQTPNFCFLITLVTAGPASLGRHAESEHLIYQSSHRVVSIFLFCRPPCTENKATQRGEETNSASGVNKWPRRKETCSSNRKVTEKSGHNEKSCWKITVNEENY